jgi:hypothetical protein
VPQRRIVHCKAYHAAKTADSPGKTRTTHDQKSQCPSWAADPGLQQFLIDEALEDTGGATDWKGRPKVLWNAVEEKTFTAVSCNTEEPLYNCYLASPPCGKLVAELQRRAERSLDDVGYRPRRA